MQTLVDNKLEIMKLATYKFYRGSEWLKCASYEDTEDSYTYYNFYHEGNILSLDILKWSEEEFKYKEIDRIVYRIQDGQLVKEYQRTDIIHAE